MTEGIAAPEVLRVAPRPAERGDTIGYVIVVGDDQAAIWWDGEHWTFNPAKAKPYLDWNEAKAMMSELRNSRGSTIRTENRPVLQGKPTIAELEAMMEGDNDPPIGLLPNGEVVAHPSRHFAASTA